MFCTLVRYMPIKKSKNVVPYSLETTGKDNNIQSDILANTPDDDKITLN